MKFENFFLLFLLYLSLSARAELTPGDLIGQTEFLDPRFEAIFNPAIGFVYAQSYVLKNILKC